MSAYMVSANHIDNLIHLALFGPVGAVNWHAPMISNPSRKLEVSTADILGREMEYENHESVKARYPTHEHTPPDRYAFPHHWFTVPPRLSAVDALKLLQCYEYQACEHKGWKESATRRFCDQLKDVLIRQLPGYDASPWEV